MSGSSWQRVDLSADEYARPTEPPVVSGLIYRGKRHAFSGPPETAKTLATVACGLDWYRAGLGRFAIVDFEMGTHAMRLLLDELGATPEEVADVYYVTADGPPGDADIAAIIEARVSLVIIDALAGAYDVSGLDDNVRRDVERWAGQWITPLWGRGITTIVLDHVVKNADSRGRYAIGSERKLGQVDVALGVETLHPLTRGGQGRFRFAVHKDRPAHLPRPHAAVLHVTSDADTHALAWTFEASRTDDTPVGVDDDLPPAARKLLEAADAIGRPATARELVDRLASTHGHGLRRETVSRTLNTLASSGHVICVNEGATNGGAKLWARTDRGVTGVTGVTSHQDHTHHGGVRDVTAPYKGRSHITPSRTHPDAVTGDEQ